MRAIGGTSRTFVAAALATVSVVAAIAPTAAAPAATGASSATGGAASSTAGAAAAPRCSTSNLRLSIAQRSAGVGRRFWAMALRNTGRSSCYLRGYPGVGMLDRRGRLIRVGVDRQTGPVATILLRPNQRAYFTFAYEDSGPCIPHFFSFYGLSVYPPNSFTRLILHTGRLDVCSPSVGGRPSVDPVRAVLEPE